MLDIEFLPESADEVDEELFSGSRAALSRWWGVAALVAVCVSALIVARGREHAAHPSATPSRSAAPNPSQIVAPLGLAPVIRARAARGPVTAVALAGSSTWVLQADALRVVRPGEPILRLQFPAAVQTVGLVGDSSARLVWLVARGLVQAYNTDTTQIVFGDQVPASSGEAAMGGHLYLAVDNRVVDVGPRAQRTILRLPGAIAAIAADPLRRRLIVVYQSGPSRVLAVVPRAHGPARVEREVTIRSIKASIGVADGRIWFAGYDTGDGVLMRLDPVTLLPDLRSSVDQDLQPGAQVVAVGSSTVWVRGAADLSDELRCVDANSGDEQQTWALPGVVASTTGRAVIGTSFGALKLDMAACRG